MLLKTAHLIAGHPFRIGGALGMHKAEEIGNKNKEQVFVFKVDKKEYYVSNNIKFSVNGTQEEDSYRGLFGAGYNFIEYKDQWDKIQKDFLEKRVKVLTDLGVDEGEARSFIGKAACGYYAGQEIAGHISDTDQMYNEFNKLFKSNEDKNTALDSFQKLQDHINIPGIENLRFVHLYSHVANPVQAGLSPDKEGDLKKHFTGLFYKDIKQGDFVDAVKKTIKTAIEKLKKDGFKAINTTTPGDGVFKNPGWKDDLRELTWTGIDTEGLNIKPQLRTKGKTAQDIVKEFFDQQEKEKAEEKRLAAEEAEAARKAEAEKNQIKLLQGSDIKDAQSFMIWNEDSYKKLTEDPKNEYNLNLFLNPKTVGGKKVFAGWGGKLKYENGNIFTITNVLKGGFADVIGLKQGDKIEIDSKHNDFAEFQGKMLEAALINKLRAGELSGIEKIGNINISEENRGGIEGLYKKNKRLFTNDNIESDKDLEVAEIKKFLENHLKKLIQKYLADPNKENCKKLEQFLSPLETPTVIGEDGNEIPKEDVDSIRIAEREAEDSKETTYLESRNVVKLIHYFTNDQKMKYSALQASSVEELTVNLSNDNPYKAIKNFKKTISCITSEKQDKRVFILADGNFFSAICQQKEKGSWVTKFYDVGGSEAEEIAKKIAKELNKENKEINRSGFIVHDGTCGIGAACMAVNFFNNDGKDIYKGKKHSECWQSILKKEASPSTTPTSPTVMGRDASSSRN